MKRSATAITILCFSICGYGQAADVAFWKAYAPDDGTVGLWHFDGTGRERLNDATGHGQRAAAAGPVVWEKKGRLGGALRIGGRGAALEIPLKVPLPGLLKANVRLPPPGTYPLSLEAWIKLEAAPKKEGVVLSRGLVPNKTGGFCLAVDSQRSALFRWQNYQPGAPLMRVATKVGAVPLNEWTHLAVVFEWGNSFALYVNGTEAGRHSFFTWHVHPSPGLVPDKESGTLFIGNGAGLESPLPGLIDEVRLATNVFQFFPLPDLSWTDPAAGRELMQGPPFTPPKEDVLLYASFDSNMDAELARGSPKALPPPGWMKLPKQTFLPGVRGRAVSFGARFQAKGNLDLREGALEFWFQPVGWDNMHNFHRGVAGGPFMVYIFNTGALYPGGTSLVAWSGDRSWTSFDTRWKAGPYYPGNWTHLLVTWKGPTVRTFINGEFRNEHDLKEGTVAEFPHYGPELSISGSNLYDEVWVYRRFLSDAETANCYWRYRDPTKLRPLPKLPCRLKYLQGASAVSAGFHLPASPVADKIRKVRLAILTHKGKKLWQGKSARPPALPKLLVQTVPRLENGTYTCAAEALGADGRILGRVEQFFSVKHYPWEHNRIGLSDRVIPPYTPLVTEGLHVRPWARDYAFGPNGLPAEIGVSWKPEGKAPRHPLLAAPIRLLASVKGKVIEETGAAVKVVSAKPHQVELRSKSRLADVPLETAVRIDYDGWCQVRLTLRPERPTTFDKLDLVCDLWPGADTLYAQRTDRREGSKFGAVPPGQGAVWHSGMLKSTGARWGSFVPVMFLGSGDMGLWWLAESDQGWATDKDTPCVQVERSAEAISMRFRFFGKPVKVSEPRTIEFALLVSPVKPKPRDWRAFAWGWPEPQYAHDTSGYRNWGDSVDAYALPGDMDYRQLRQFILNPVQVNPNYAWFQRLADEVKKGKPIVLYGSTWMTGAGFPEMDTYQTEWLDTYNWVRPMPDPTYLGRTNYSNTVRWRSPRQLSATGVNFCQTQIDCFLWYHRKLVELARVNGTWWDNRSIGLIYDFVPGRGKVWKWNVFARRQLTKRLATMGWDLGVPPLWLQNMHVDFSWCQVGWHIENDFYIRRAGMDMLDQLSMDEFRSLLAIKGGLIPQLHSRIPESGEFKVTQSAENAPVPLLEASRHAGDAWDILRGIRSILGLCLLHDVGERGLPLYLPFYKRDRKRVLEALENSVRFFSGYPEFIPYWRSNSAIQFTSSKIFASVYVYRRGPVWAERTPLAPRAAAVIFNGNDRDVTAAGMRLFPKAFGLKRIHRVYDGETGLPLARILDRKTRTYHWGEHQPGKLAIRRHDYRLLIVE